MLIPVDLSPAPPRPPPGRGDAAPSGGDFADVMASGALADAGRGGGVPQPLGRVQRDGDENAFGDLEAERADVPPDDDPAGEVSAQMPVIAVQVEDRRDAATAQAVPPHPGRARGSTEMAAGDSKASAVSGAGGTDRTGSPLRVPTLADRLPDAAEGGAGAAAPGRGAAAPSGPPAAVEDAEAGLAPTGPARAAPTGAEGGAAGSTGPSHGPVSGPPVTQAAAPAPAASPRGPTAAVPRPGAASGDMAATPRPVAAGPVWWTLAAPDPSALPMAPGTMAESIGPLPSAEPAAPIELLSGAPRVETPAPWHPPPPTATQPAAPQLATQLALAARSLPDGPVEITLAPAELGRVTLTLSGTDGALVVTVVAERGETLDLLRRSIGQLAEELRALGYDNPGFAFRQEQRDPDRHRPGPSATAIALVEGAPDSAPKVTMAAGRLDLRL